MKVIYFFFLFTGFSSAGASGAGSSAFGSSFLSSISVVISSIGFGGGVVAIVQPIHAPMKRIATKAMNTGAAMSQYETASMLGSHDQFRVQYIHEYPNSAIM